MTPDDPEAPIAPAAGPAASKLALALARLPVPRFAVIDGGHWDDLPAELRKGGLQGRSLFLGAGHDIEVAGPHLVDLDGSPDAARAVLDLVGDRPAAVFWGGAPGQGALWHHLRTLNQAEIPSWAAEGRPAPLPGEPDRAVTVMFRHWDPGVLGALMPVLDADQFARVLGPAAELLFHAPEHGGVRRVVADSAGQAPRGWLRLRGDQVVSLSERRVDASDRRVAGFLREAAPEETAGRSDTDLIGDVAGLRQSSLAMGIRTERSQAWWAYLMLSTQGQVGRSPRLRTYLASGPGTPDAKVDGIRDHMLLLSRSERQVD